MSKPRALGWKYEGNRFAVLPKNEHLGGPMRSSVPTELLQDWADACRTMGRQNHPRVLVRTTWPWPCYVKDQVIYYGISEIMSAADE